MCVARAPLCSSQVCLTHTHTCTPPRYVGTFSILLKLLKIVKFERTWQDAVHRQYKTSKLKRGLRLSLYLIVLLHWLGCFWNTMGTSTEYVSWMDGDADLRDKSDYSRYVASLYWSVATLTSVGYGDYSANAPEEQIFNIAIMMIGCVGYAFVIGAIANFLETFNRAKRAKTKMLKLLEGFMTDADLPESLKERCRNATVTAADHLNLETRARQCLENLPNGLSTEVLMYMHRVVIRDIKFLRERVDRYPQFVALTASKMQLPMKAKLGDLLVQEGSTAEDMYFLNQGTVIAVRQGFPVMELHHGKHGVPPFERTKLA